MFSRTSLLFSLFRDSKVSFQPLHTAEEVGEDLVSRDAAMDKALLWLQNMFLKYIETVIGNLTTFGTSKEQLLQ